MLLHSNELSTMSTSKDPVPRGDPVLGDMARYICLLILIQKMNTL